MLQLWLTSATVGTLLAWCFGLDPFAPYLYEVIILGALVFGAGFLILVTGLLGSSILMLLVLGALPLAMAYSEHTLQQDIKPRNAFHRYGDDAPVSLQTWIEGSHLYGRITNRHSRDWLRLAMVHCKPVYANGTPSHRVREISVSAGGWLAPGEEVEQSLLTSSGLLWTPGMAMSRTTCKIGSADFYADSESKPTFEYARDSEYRYVFEVTNTRQDANLKRVGFSCWVLNAASGSRPHKTNWRAKLLNADGALYVVQPGKCIALHAAELFSGRTIIHCVTSDILCSSIDIEIRPF